MHGLAQDRIFETNITNDLNLSSGEPQIALDPANPRNLAIIEFAVGSVKVPAYKSNPLMVGPELRDAANEHNGRIMLSTDGGNTWTASAPPLKDSRFANGADPAIAYGPDGSLYVDTVLAAKVMADMRDVSGFRNVIAVSRDGGKTFTIPEVVESAPASAVAESGQQDRHLVPAGFRL